MQKTALSLEYHHSKLSNDQKLSWCITCKTMSVCLIVQIRWKGIPRWQPGRLHLNMHFDVCVPQRQV